MSLQLDPIPDQIQSKIKIIINSGFHIKILINIFNKIKT